MCHSEQQSIEQNICELLQQIKGCCTSKEEIDNIKLQLDSIQLWINSFEGGIPKTDNILLSSTIGEIDENSTLQDVLEYLYNLIDNIQLEGSVNLSISNRNANTLDVIPSSGNGTTIPSVSTSLAGLMSAADKVKLNSISSNAEENAQSDWNESNNTSDAFIKNKPTIPSITGLATEIYVNNAVSQKQDVLVSGTNLKSINNQSLIGSGNLNISSGEINTASNLGTLGEGVFKQKSGVNLEFKKINAASNKISITSDAEKIDVDVNVFNLTGIAQSQITNLVNDLSLKASLDSPNFTGVVTGITKSMIGLGNTDNTPDISKPVSTPTQNALNLKQKTILFQNKGTNLGTSGIVETINFTGATVNASLSGVVLTVDVTGGSGGGATNLDYIPSPTQGTVTSDTGLDATLPLATGTNAGLLSPSGFTKLGNISVTQAVDLDQLEADTILNNAKISNATHTGDVTGSTALTLATINPNVGTFGNGTQIPQLTVNAKGLITGVSSVTITPTATSITGAGNITKTDDTNVTLTLGGTPIGSVLSNVSFTLGWTGTLADNRISSATNWNTAFTNRITSLTTTGNSGAATLISNVLNIPTYTLSGLGGQASLNGTGIVKSTAGTISYISDNSISWDKSYQQNKIRVVSVNTTLSATTDGTVIFDTAGTTATLPSSVNETILVIKNNSIGTITVLGHIDGVSSVSYVLQTKESMKFHGNGTTWYYIG